MSVEIKTNTHYSLTMNFLTLSPGQSIFIPADGIHAYLSGDIIECMARSNNVLNTGFCPRAERNNIETFISTLTFSPHSPEECMLEPKPYQRSKSGKTVVYAPPMSEFDMLLTKLEKGESDTVSELGGPSVLLVTEGKGSMKAGGKSYDLSAGYIFFVGHGVEVTYEAEETMAVYRAFVE